MKLKRMLFGPSWRSKDPQVRLRAVANDHDHELDAQLSVIAREDNDTRVRLAALKRLDDPRRYLEAARDDDDPSLRRQVLDLALRQLSGERPSRLDVKQRVLLIEEIQQSGELEALARTAREVEVRRAALARVTRAQVLLEAATVDSDADLRLETLHRIEDPALLKRVAESTRKSDKYIHRAALARLEQARLAADDPGAKRTRGESICAEAEALMRRPGGDLAATAESLRQRWQALGIDSTHPLQARFRGALEVIDHLLAPKPEAPPPVPELVEPLVTPSASTLETVPSPEVTPALTQRATKPSPPDCSRELEHLTSLLGEGHVREARVLEALIFDLRPRGADAARFANLRQQLAEMLRWQRWSMQDQRIRLCNEVEKLIDSGIHPDALATRIRELRQQWNALETLAGEDAPEAITRRFHALCHRVLKPAKGYFQKREALRSDHTQAAKALVEEIGRILEGEDVRPLHVLRRRAASTLRDAANLTAAERPTLVAAIKQALTDMDVRLSTTNSEILKRKKSLLVEAEALAQSAPGQAVREVKRLQAEWKATGTGSRRDEEPLWKRFRAACDQVFSELDNQRAQREAQASTQRNEAEMLITRMTSLDPTPNEATLREIRTLWRDLDVRETDLRRRFENAEAAVARHTAEARQATLRSHLDALLNEAEVRHRNLAPISQHPPTADADPSVNRLGGDSQATDEAAHLCVRLEFLAGIPSPNEDRQRRMDYQVARLAERMAGSDERAGLGMEIEAILRQWRDLQIDAPNAAAYASRLRQALDALQAQL